MKDKSLEGNGFPSSGSQFPPETTNHVSGNPVLSGQFQDTGVYALPTPPATPIKKGNKDLMIVDILSPLF